MNEIFLSYRRADEKGTTGRLFDHLVQAFGREAIFYDVDKIPHGDDFREFIDTTIRNCKVVLVVIGPRWLEMADESGQRRLEKVNDPVRIEVETALRWHKRVVPVLIDEARMPTTATLPATIEQLGSQNAAPMHNNQYFEQDINALLDDITRMGVARKTQGFIVNPPSAGLLTGKQTAALVSIPLVLVALGIAAVLGVGYLGYQLINNASTGFNSPATNGAHVTLNAFCSAMASKDYTTAWSYLDSNLQSQIGSPSSLPTKLTTDFFGNQVTVIGCQAFQAKGPDGFYVENGNTANDQVKFDAQKSDGTSETITNKVMFFSKQGTTWYIDRIQNS